MPFMVFDKLLGWRFGQGGAYLGPQGQIVSWR